MVFDFSEICNTYDAKSYKKEDFVRTRCPKCPRVGAFKLHGSYYRHVLYFFEQELMYEYMEIKRIMCCSCKTTHAVMPGDIIPYKLLSLLVLLSILSLFYVVKMPVLTIVAECGFSFQFIYCALGAFKLHKSRIYQHFREISCELTPPNLDEAGIISLIKKPYASFQSVYIKFNKRPCFMCRFFDGIKAPPVGQMPPVLPLQGQQHSF